MRLVRARKTAAGRIEIAFAQGATVKEETFEAVVLALPFTTLREVDLDPSLGLPDSKRNAITSLGYGTNAKMMIGFNGRPWLSLGSNGEAYSDLSHHQLTWETNPIRASASRGVLTDYSSGRRGATLNPNDVQNEANLFLLDLDNVFAGALASAARSANGSILAHLEHWPSNPLSKGSYTCYRPGQFTSIAGNEGPPVGNLYFAGEHANSFTSGRALWKARRFPEYRQHNKSFTTSKPARSVEICVCWHAFSMDAVPSSCSPRSLKRTRSDLDDVAALD
jgi:monoamine oxidase